MDASGLYYQSRRTKSNCNKFSDDHKVERTQRNMPFRYRESFRFNEPFDSIVDGRRMDNEHDDIAMYYSRPKA